MTGSIRFSVDEHWQLDDDICSRYLQWAVALMLICGLALWCGAESLHLDWPVERLALYLTLLPVVVLIGASRSPHTATGILVFGLVLLAWVIWTVTGDERAWVLLALPACAACIGFGERQGLLGAVIATGWAVWRLPPWGGTTIVWCLLVLMVVWLTQLTAQAAVRGARFSAQWAQQSYEAMRKTLEEALDQRVELKQTRDDLVQANTQLERLAERLALMTQVAEEAKLTKERFLANVSHELRTPLNMIIGFAEMMTQSPDVYEADLPGALLADIEVIRRNSQHLASLVDDILDLSRTEAGHIALVREWANLAEVVQEAMNAVKPLFATKGLYLRMDSAPDLPDVYCDRIRIRQVILNLLSNAGRFTAQGGVQLTLSGDAAGVLCSVADTGKGIPADDRDRIFEPFYQSGSQLLRRRDGTGLGLSISRSMIELHGGSLWLESEPGQGTTFLFRLPVATQSAANGVPLSRWFSPYNEHVQRERTSLAPRPQLKPRLVVLEAGTAMTKTLRRHAGDAEVVNVKRLEDALLELDREPADVLVVNDESAEAVARCMEPLSHLPKATPAAVCWLPADEEVAARLGVTRYLVKPVSRIELLDCLSERSELSSILIVDDDPEALQMLTRMALTAPRQYELLRASDARRALDLMRAYRPGLVLLDMYLPDMSGFELLKLKQADPDIAPIEVIAVSAHDPTMSLARGGSLTLVQSRPLSIHDLLDGMHLLRQTAGQGQQ